MWPGDTPPTREVLQDLSRGDPVTLSTLRTTVHLGAHADAPSHYGADAPDIASRSLAFYLGPCEVMRVTPVCPPAASWYPRCCPAPPKLARLLIATGSAPDPNRFTKTLPR